MAKYIWLCLLVAFQVRSNAQQPKELVIRMDIKNKAQRIDNFGAAGAWYSEAVAQYWPEENREKMAEWLFSKVVDVKGNPKGIGLSAWRFNIGAGTAEQGDSSGIRDIRRRVECFMNPDGTYNWSKQAGYVWFTKKAKAYGVENLIAFSNTPPVHFTQNRLGYKTEKNYLSNLKPDRYRDYANFLTTVLQHFDQEGLHFRYISPVNEPQWDWYHPYMQGSQEGTPWRNDEIVKIVRSLDSTLTLAKSTTKILITEAGQLDYLYGKNGGASHQIQHFFRNGSPMQLNKLRHVPNIIGGHSYFTDKGDSSRISIRQHVADTTRKYGTEFWQTEYSMLADGYKEGKSGKIPAMDCALFLSKVIHDDLVYGNATAWQLWNSWEPGSADFDTRYYIIALHPANREFTNGTVSATKNLWALGHYSRFVRPGMHRLDITRNDQLTREAIARDVMVTAYTDEKQLVLVAVNYTSEPRLIRPEITGIKLRARYDRYDTSAEPNKDMTHSQHSGISAGVLILPRSLTTIVLDKK
jgi:O-glycosyl hydrolase